MIIKKKELIENAIFSIKIDDLGYVLSQLRDDSRMDVFDNLKDKDEWQGEDLNNTNILFTIVVAEHKLLKLFSNNVTSVVKANKRPRLLLGLSLSKEIRESTSMPGLRLIKYDKVYDPNNVEVIIPILDPIMHKDIIYSYEYIGMQGNYKEIKDRILKYYKEGIDWDKQKAILYPDVELPSKGYKKILYKVGKR
ncbi:hypothetical protein CPU12_04980 [Malaciobacter molluscorum LMG 25693]|uniref:Uncharacterized protein n=1 Tax=Malaciobacter molluscorum LMG 25693 TaxID=870501 RepID=A0A2G1DJX0_9BACT|nr:hypothetical protein [Malaciobacter molluscorum]AXX91567.1 hypothetical protein AMOL_0565 [Malaciobacter molluscorum LMG 25693]PHO18636.1 hypothetical protein CPU12_04980 [Malaciobacter molluscorum LMG 25693]